MSDIKSDKQIEKPLSLNEQVGVNQKKLKQSLERLDEKERAANFAEKRKNVLNEINQADKAAAAAASLSAASLIAPVVKRQKQVENILAQGLEEIYLNLEPPKRQEFKKTGEETAKKISQLLTKAKINIREIIKLIKKWLALIPGINRYFLEQEAKIKADEIVKMKSYNDK